MNGFPTILDLNILPLGSYDVLIGMDSLEQHDVMLDFLNKSILFMDNQGNDTKIQGISNKVSFRHISTLQENNCITKGCKLFAINIQDVEVEREQDIKYFSVLVDFKMYLLRKHRDYHLLAWFSDLGQLRRLSPHKH